MVTMSQSQSRGAGAGDGNGEGGGASASSSAAAAGANSGSQYALCALGVGLVALGIVMIVWSVVPVDANNSSRPGLDAQGRTSSVAFVLVGAGVTMLLLSLCLGIRNKQRRQGLPTNGLPTAYNTQISADDSADVLEERFTVPSYEEVVGSGSFVGPATMSGSGSRLNSTSQLPSYEDVLETEGHPPDQAPPTTPPPTAVPPGASGGRWNGRTARKLLPLKIRRIKSEKLRVKRASSASSPPPHGGAVVFSIEPLTPPPQYDDQPPQL